MIFLQDIRKHPNFATVNIKTFIMKKIIALLLMLITLSPSQASEINVKRKETMQQGRPRIPSMTRVVADYENGVVTLKITDYTGNVQVYVSDSQGNVIGYTLATVSGKGTVTFGIDTVTSGCYLLNIVLDNATYYGQFYV